MGIGIQKKALISKCHSAQSTDRQCSQRKSTCHLQYNDNAFEEQSFFCLNYLLTVVPLRRKVLQQHKTGLKESRLLINYLIYSIHDPSFYIILV